TSTLLSEACLWVTATDKALSEASDTFTATDKALSEASDGFSATDKTLSETSDSLTAPNGRGLVHPETTTAYAVAEQYDKGDSV
ncbi:MAG: hypothetical protein K2J50_05345, partial [Treponemataceae bacterium]|nr:hypothetical protein [Treponemataceae bacterium]